MASSIVRSALALVTIALVLAGPAPSADAGTKTIDCYPAQYDRDGDGYATAAPIAMAVTADGVIYKYVTAVDVTVDSSKLNCPSGYVNEKGDCDDANAAVHPRRDELAFNGVDDNCNGPTDESEWLYSAAGNGNTDTSFRMTLKINSVDVRNAVPDLWVTVAYSRLTDTSVTHTQTFQVTAVNWFYPTATFTLTGLSPSTAYRARATLAKADGTYLGSVSHYYTTTDVSPSWWGEPQGATRTQIVLRALKEYDESERGRVGYRGSVARDGTRYGASLNEKWCTEFYAWVTNPWIDYSWYFTTTTTDGMSAFFGSEGAWYGSSSVASLARRGDYLGLDTDSPRDGDVNHSGMVLAVDRRYDPPQVWTVEGNISGHRVNVQRRNIGTDVLKLGRITSGMLD